jgi:MFS family permease
MFCNTFYLPIFTNHLINNFGFSVDTSSYFYSVNSISYLFLIRYLDFITHKLGLKLTLVVGLIIDAISVILLPPVNIIPQYSIIIILGLVLQGLGTAAITVPGICDLIETLKLNEFNLEEIVSNDVASAMYNLAINCGEALGPLFGGYYTNKKGFQTCCVYVSFITFFFFMIFSIFNI